MSRIARKKAEIRIAESIRQACIDAAIEGYERAAMSGLCREGAWECALDAIRMLDLDALVEAPVDKDEALAAEFEAHRGVRTKIETRSTGKTRK